MSQMPPTLTAWFFALPGVAQATVAMGLLAFGAAVFSAFSSFASMRVSARQAGTASKALFVSLLPRRIEWLDGFRKAVADRQTEMVLGMAPDAQGQLPEPVALFAVADGRRNARWLFDQSVGGIATDIENLLATKTRLIVSLRTPGVRPTAEQANAPGGIAVQIDAKVGDLIEYCRPFLYVGDVKRTAKEVSVHKRIKGIGTATLSPRDRSS